MVGSAFRPVIGWVEDQDNVITDEALEQQFGPMGAEPVDDVLVKIEQVHVALLASTESESFDIVLGAASSGLEALILVQIGANCKKFPRDSRSGRNWCADTKGANRAER